jgi:hypothetical protein
MGLKEAERTFTARHTRNVDTALEDAQTVLRISTEWAKEFKATAERMLTIPVPQSSQAIDKVLNTIFPKKADETDRQRKNRDENLSLVRSLYANERNAGGFGYNGWSIYNTVVEYLDHWRDDDKIAMATASMDDNSWVTRKKMDTQRAVLSLV